MPDENISIDMSLAEKLLASYSVDKLDKAAQRIGKAACHAYLEALTAGKVSGCIFTYGEDYVIFGSSKGFFETNWNAMGKDAKKYFEDNDIKPESTWLFTDGLPIPIPMKIPY